MLWYVLIKLLFLRHFDFFRQFYLTRINYANDDSDDELITNMEPVDVFVNSNEPTFVYTESLQ